MGSPLHLDVLTLFPGLFGPFMEEGLIGRAREGGLIQLEALPLRPWGLGRHRNVDDVPYGGGAGMVLRPEPVFAAVRDREAQLKAQGIVTASRPLRKILLTPQGQPFRQPTARRLAALDQPMVLICGRYEGFDERIRSGLADEEISGGDFICLGGEAVAMAIIEAVVRLVPGVLGNPDSTAEESFAGEGLEYPQYTRPPVFEGMEVPPVLLSGNHQDIARWRAEQSARRTAQRRPDLLKNGKEHDAEAITQKTLRRVAGQEKDSDR
ncbi:MAG: tRNA (guanosine(37)-N1)-methyltransferase TrmD [Deltaproteobacteria bacterium]|nr:tRNA (guanosine(37)-N1)-methyltransferase TrmD [Deltaproteobacteria bacterium]